MWWRLAFPLVFMFGPRVIPRVVRTLYVVWKLIFDRRVPLLLRLLVPATLIYFATLGLRLPPVLSLGGYILVLSVAVWALLNLAPHEVVEGYAPWRAKARTERRSGGTSRVVEGSARVVDEDEPAK